MSALEAPPKLEQATAKTKLAGAPDEAFARHMRAEAIWLALIALLIFVTGILLHGGYWLEVALANRAYHADDIVIAVFAVSFVLMVFLLRGWQAVRQEAAQRAEAVKQIEQRNAVNAQLSQMTSLLHACFALEEASKIIAHFARQLLPEYAGALYVFRSSRNLLELTTVWGDTEGNESMFAPQQCWGLRQGQMYAVSDPQRSILCEHVHHDRPYTCLPLMAHGEVLALLHIAPMHGNASVEVMTEQHYALLRAFTEPIALALSNLKLRESLRQQSIRDALTGLFNRRYLEEALTIELERAKRNTTPFSIIMIDLDHFKRFNDTHGHEAGDAVLQALGGFLRRSVRGGDIACRYGGEEFTLILPGTPLEVAHQRAEQLCEGIRALHIDYKDQILGPMSLSIGLATYPHHGDSGETVLHAADAALYQAKNDGRDRVAVAV